jgi:biotin carboxylase
VEKYLIEINPRPFLQSTIDTFVATNINMAALCVKFCCGIPYTQEFCESQKNRVCATRYVVRNGSSVRGINGVAEACKVPGVKSVHVNDSHFYRRGPGTSVLDRIVTVHSEANTIEEAAACAQRALEKMTVVYDRFPMNFVKYHLKKIRSSLEKAIAALVL